MASSISTQPVTVREAFSLPCVEVGDPVLLTPSADLNRAVRWAHITGLDRPAEGLEGGELILSTLPRLSEDREDLAEALYGYISDLDRIGAAGLAVEVFDDRPRLLTALREIAHHRNLSPRADTLLPILHFRQFIRFQTITAALHRELISRELDADAPLWDPFVWAATNLFDDLSAPQGLPHEEAEERGVALGMPRGRHYIAAIVRLESDAPHATKKQVSHLATLARESSQGIHHPTLIGAGANAEFCALTALPKSGYGSPSSSDVEVHVGEVLRQFHRTMTQRRSYEIVPRYLIGVNSHPVPIWGASQALRQAAGIARTATKLGASKDGLSSAPQQVQERGYWLAEDLGLHGLMAYVNTHPDASWFVDHHLKNLPGDETNSIRQLVSASVSVGGNKTELAKTLQISRPTLYSKLDRLERLLGKPLTGETFTALHLAFTLQDVHTTALKSFR